MAVPTQGVPPGQVVIFKMTPNGTYTVLHNINGTTDGNGPWGSLIQATNGNTTYCCSLIIIPGRLHRAGEAAENPRPAIPDSKWLGRPAAP